MTLKVSTATEIV